MVESFEAVGDESRDSCKIGVRESLFDDLKAALLLLVMIGIVSHA